MYRVVPGYGGTRLVGQEDPEFESLGDAINQACSYLAMGKIQTRIETDDGRFVDGSDLAAVCRGERTLNDDLTTS
jgi:hypothetical protein